jgi:hypothetical protein
MSNQLIAFKELYMQMLEGKTFDEARYSEKYVENIGEDERKVVGATVSLLRLQYGIDDKSAVELVIHNTLKDEEME